MTMTMKIITMRISRRPDSRKRMIGVRRITLPAFEVYDTGARIMIRGMTMKQDPRILGEKPADYV